jgi:hypothetical protein
MFAKPIRGASNPQGPSSTQDMARKRGVLTPRSIIDAG